LVVPVDGPPVVVEPISSDGGGASLAAEAVEVLVAVVSTGGRSSRSGPLMVRMRRTFVGWSPGLAIDEWLYGGGGLEAV
jgi:hypothetical protein